MRLVQAAANSKEQNLEAYLENSQLYYRSTRKINKNEELLVWYDEELSRLLGFNEIKAQSPQNGKHQTAGRTEITEDWIEPETYLVCADPVIREIKAA